MCLLDYVWVVGRIVICQCEFVNLLYDTCSIIFLFFFSSRRRHTILQGDWSSDVCSSDLEPTARALQSVRPAAPILFLAIDYHPLESGVVTNLRSPDRNTTGVFVPQNVLVARRVEILRQLLPQAKRLMVFADSYSADQVESARKAAAAAKFQLVLVQFGGQPYEYNTYLQDTRSIEADAFMNLASPVFTRDRRQIRDALLRL